MGLLDRDPESSGKRLPKSHCTPKGCNCARNDTAACGDEHNVPLIEGPYPDWVPFPGL